MPAIYPSGLTGDFGETLALTTGLASKGAPGIEYKQLTFYAPSVDFRAHFNPAIRKIFMYDYSGAANSRFLDLTRAMEERSGTGTYLDGMTVDDRLYICSSDITGGIYITMTSANGTSNTMAVEYWNGSAWTNITPTDGTDTGASLAQSGAVTWTAPTTWPEGQFTGYNTYKSDRIFQQTDAGIDTDAGLSASATTVTWDADASTNIPAGTIVRIESELMYVSSTAAGGLTSVVVRGYLGSTAATHTTNQDVYVVYNGKDQPTEVGKWLRCYFDVALDSDTEIASIWTLNKDSNRSYFRHGVEYNISLDRRNIGSFEALLAAGTDTLEVNWIKNIQG
jgi:hypothetical protein